MASMGSMVVICYAIMLVIIDYDRRTPELLVMLYIERSR